MSRDRALTVRGPYKGPSGHDHHVREFVRHLYRAGIRIELVDVPEWGPVKLPDDLRDPWFDSLGAPVGSAAVLHFCMPHQVRVRGDRLNVNYTMFEATRIPGRWITHNLRHDLVILPTESSRQAWVESGFPPDRIRLCPLGVDPERFQPGVAPLELADRHGGAISEYRTRVLNVSELGPRKNLLGLLRVWIRATAPSDDAILVIKLGRYAPGWTVRFMRDLDAAERAIGKTRKESAPILFLDRLLADSQMPRLFAAATHYWSMSHGEGWDQPMMEAASTGLRLIAPCHTAYLSYLDEAIARMIPASRVPATFAGGGVGWLQRVHPRSAARLFEGAEWWQPDEEAAARAVREAVTGGDFHRASPRERITASFTWEQATARLVTILEELHGRHGRRF